VDRKRRITGLGQWWAQASQEQRRLLVQRGQKGEASLTEIHLAALVAEAEQGTVDGPAQQTARALGERLRRC